MRKFKILYVNSFSDIGGAENSLVVLVNNIDKAKFKLYAVLPKDGLLNKFLTKNGVEIKVMSLEKLKAKNPFPYIKTIFRLYSFIKNNNIDLVHCNESLCNQFTLPAARLAGVLIISHVRNIYTKRAIRRLFLNYCDRLIAISQTVSNSTRPHLKSPHKMVVVHNGVDFPKSKKKSIFYRKRFGIEDNFFVIGQFGRIVPEKGQEILIKAMKKVVLNHPNSCCVIAGDIQIDNTEEYLDYLKSLVTEFGLSKNVRFVGFVEDVIHLYDCINVLVVPSISDACGRAAIEAMAMSKPVLASAVGTAFEMITDNINGLLFSPEDDSELADAIIKLIENQELARKIGTNGRIMVEEKFSIENNVKQIECEYMSLLEDHQNK